MVTHTKTLRFTNFTDLFSKNDLKSMFLENFHILTSGETVRFKLVD